MHTQIRQLIALFVAILALPLSAAEKDKHSAKFSDLHVTATRIDDTQSAPHKGDHHHVAVFVRVENAGKGVICASFIATLRTGFDLQYGSDWLPPFPPPPKMHEMLPGESAEGSYEFNVRDGVQPLELTLRLWGPKQPQNGKLVTVPRIRCGANGTERDALPTEVRLDVHDLPAPEKPPSPQGSR